MIEQRVKINPPQARFLPVPQKYRAFIGGFGSSKTHTGCLAMCQHFSEFPGVNQGYFAPTYPHIRDIFYPTIDRVAELYGLNVDIKQGNHEVSFYNPAGQFLGVTICRSMDKPGNIIGFEIGHAMIDELDVMPTDKAEQAWIKIQARLRAKSKHGELKNGIDVTSTPEGFKFCHKKFVQAVADNPALNANYAIIQASTYENEKNLPPDYIPSLKETYPAELIEAYLNGQFVNLTSGTVYHNYDRVRCNSNEGIIPGEPLFIGQDFNVQKMCSAVFVQRSDGYHAVAELKDVFDTPAVVNIIKEKWHSKGHRIIIYPDASGGSRKTVDASKSDIALLTLAGFAVRSHASNPQVKDRVLATNKALEAGKIKVNAAACPTLARCLERQAYDDNGEPDKSAGYDHMTDAFSYFVAYEFPVIKPMSRIRLAGM